MNIALVDDDLKCLDEMARLCRIFAAQNRCQMEISTFTSGEDFLKTFDTGNFSVVFMDIYMEKMNGITASLKMRTQDDRCLLVFLTSSTDFMPAAFSLHAFEYITKPFSPQRIASVLKDAIKILPTSAKYIELPNGRSAVPLLLSDIASVVTDAHYLNIGLADGTVFRARMTISEFMEHAKKDARFILVNKGILVNADHILDFEDNCCILENNARFPIRVRDRRKIIQTVQDYHFDQIRRRQVEYSGCCLAYNKDRRTVHEYL
ncbi:MAG: response regulator transcription factor [Coprococcus sp.]|nr:response regulator transcription factor [Coprococcus sp.]